MLKVAIVVLADTETHGDMGRVSNALRAVQEFKKNGDDVKLIFDGAGVKWVGALTDKDNPLHGLFDSVKDKVDGVCLFCAGAFGGKDSVEAGNTPFADDYEGHPSFRSLLAEGYQVITF